LKLNQINGKKKEHALKLRHLINSVRAMDFEHRQILEGLDGNNVSLFLLNLLQSRLHELTSDNYGKKVFDRLKKAISLLKQGNKDMGLSEGFFLEMIFGCA
jgi:hypothetical protein